MKVLEPTISFLRQNPETLAELALYGASRQVKLVGVQYIPLVMTANDESKYPNLFKYLRACGIEGNQTVLVEFH